MDYTPEQWDEICSLLQGLDKAWADLDELRTISKRSRMRPEKIEDDPEETPNWVYALDLLPERIAVQKWLEEPE